MMSLIRTPLILYILFIFHLHYNFASVGSLSSSVDTNKETLHLNESTKPDVDVFEEKARELAVVIKRGGSGGAGGGGGSSTGGGGGGSGGSTSGGGGGGDSSTGGGGVSGQSWSNGGGRFGSSYVGGNRTRGSHRSSGSQNIRGAVCAAGWFGLTVLSGLIFGLERFYVLVLHFNLGCICV
ncbi:hypothetical protein Bca4012_053521 [Brassica carinata]